MLDSPALRWSRPSYIPKFVPDANCVLWYPGQDDAYSSTIKDHSGQGNHGTITGTTYWTIQNGFWVLNFDGDDIVTVTQATSINNLANYTLLAWVRPDAVVGTAARIFDKGGLWLYIYPTTFKMNAFRDYDGVRDSTSISTDTVSTETWHLLGATHTSADKKMRISQDGAEVGAYDTQDSGSGNLVSDATADLTIGDKSDSSRPLDGRIALPRIFNRVLSATEILGYYNQERHLFGV